ncbi:MAG TPA: hypothetical protein VKU82_08740, partial [Planctomycetaceae bacterium]|nr:hypothetical protein [Planctomycetaceae bacterium]
MNTGRKLSRRKRLAFTAIVLVSLYLLLEVVSLCAYRMHYGRWYTWSAAAGERAAAARSGKPEAMPDFATGVIHPYLGSVTRPGWRPDDPNFKYPFLWPEEFTNRPFDGFPSRRPVVEHRAPGVVIVGIFGGSVAEVYYRQGIQVTLEKLAKRAEYHGKKFLVVCLAGGGYKQPQQLMALNYVLAQGGQFDLVINIDGFNEVALHAAENAKKGVFPIYPRDWYFLVGQIRDAEMLKLLGRKTSLEDRIRDWARFFSRRPLSYSPACHLLWRARSRVLERQLHETIAAAE